MNFVIFEKKKKHTYQKHNQDNNEVFTFDSDTHGHLYMKSQVQDYVLQGECFENLNFLDFMVETYEVTVRKGRGD